MFENFAFVITCRKTSNVSNAVALDPTICLKSDPEKDKKIMSIAQGEAFLTAASVSMLTLPLRETLEYFVFQDSFCRLGQERTGRMPLCESHSNYPDLDALQLIKQLGENNTYSFYYPMSLPKATHRLFT